MQGDDGIGVLLDGIHAHPPLRLVGCGQGRAHKRTAASADHHHHLHRGPGPAVSARPSGTRQAAVRRPRKEMG